MINQVIVGVLTTGCLFMLTIGITSCSNDNTKKESDDMILEGHYAHDFREYSIKSDVIRKILTEKIIPSFAKDSRNKGKTFGFIFQTYEPDEQDSILCIVDHDFQMADIIPNNCGWFEFEGFQFVVDKSAQKYFCENVQTHKFEYEYYATEYDPWEWVFKIKDDSYELLYEGGEWY